MAKIYLKTYIWKLSNNNNSQALAKYDVFCSMDKGVKQNISCRKKFLEFNNYIFVWLTIPTSLLIFVASVSVFWPESTPAFVTYIKLCSNFQKSFNRISLVNVLFICFVFFATFHLYSNCNNPQIQALWIVSSL